MLVQPYLMFEGRCEEAVEFYRRAVGAEVMTLMRYSQAPDPKACPSPTIDPQKVMHCCLRVGDSQVMMSDGMCSGTPSFKGINLSLTARDEAEAERLFQGLSDGGQVQMPMAPTFFAKRFGMVADRFGVGWMVISGPMGG